MRARSERDLGKGFDGMEGPVQPDGRQGLYCRYESTADSCRAWHPVGQRVRNPEARTPQKAWSGLQAKTPADDLRLPLGDTAEPCSIPDAGKPASGQQCRMTRRDAEQDVFRRPAASGKRPAAAV